MSSINSVNLIIWLEKKPTTIKKQKQMPMTNKKMNACQYYEKIPSKYS